ncbi:hypothetical protein QFC21_004630 [Naganishia friedmannii]|uniref:Uncharacterized protein n=1 Tax=Naganishia friedmannii TaxID=89922 RepID=A0ACC2VEU5_9TREE|nr:hypothetical protein QFC21_004630 [Naganishia friedmannii]
MLEILYVPNRRPRASLAIFDPLASIDIASLPPLPSTPPSASHVDDHARDLSLNSTSLTLLHYARETNDAAATSSLPTDKHTTTTTQKPAKLVDIVTPMPMTGRALHSAATRPRNVHPAFGNEVAGSDGKVFVERPVDVIPEENEEQGEQSASLERKEDVLPNRDDARSTGPCETSKRDTGDRLEISTIEEELEEETSTPTTTIFDGSLAASVGAHNRAFPSSLLRSSTTTESTIPHSSVVTTTSTSTSTQLVSLSPARTIGTPFLRPREEARDEAEQQLRATQPLLVLDAEETPFTSNSTLPSLPSNRTSTSEGDTSRFPGLYSHRDRGDKTAGGTTMTTTTTMMTTMDLMDEDQSFLEAMRRSSSFSPSSSRSSRSAIDDHENNDTLTLCGAGKGPQSPQRMDGAVGDDDIEATPMMMGRWKGKGRAMDLPAATNGESTSGMRPTNDEVPLLVNTGGGVGAGKTSRNAFGSVLAGMAEYEATITRSAIDRAGHDQDRRHRTAALGVERGMTGDGEGGNGLASGVVVVVSKASDSPLSFAARDSSSTQPRQLSNSSSSASTHGPDNGLLSVHRPGPTKPPAEGDGDISTVFPSSPSIKRYMNTQRAETRARTYEQKCAVPGSSSLFRSNLDDADTSRLDLVDLSDLRKPSRIDGGGGNQAEISVAFLDTSLMVSSARAPHRRQNRQELDRSTIYPSSPAVKRNMEQRSMTVDLLRDEIGLDDLATMDSRLERSVMLPSLETGDVARSEMLTPLVNDRLSVAAAPSSSSTPTTRLGPTTFTVEPGRKAHREATKTIDDDTGDQTLDIGALIKKTSRKLASDMMIADSTFSGSDFLGLGGSRGVSGGSRDQRPEMSMLLDTKSPFKPRNPGADSSSTVVFGNTRVHGNGGATLGDVDESYYDLLGDDNTFMKEVGDVTVGGETLILGPTKGHILPVALLNRAPPAARSQHVATNEFEFKVPQLPRGFTPSRASDPSLTAHKRPPSTSPIRPSRLLPKPSTSRLSPVRANPTSSEYGLPPFTPARADCGDKTSTTRKFVPTSTQTSVTPRSTAGPEYKRSTVSNYRSTAVLPPRTPLAERGFGPQSAKKASTSSLTSVLHETDGRTINTRDPTRLTGPPRSGTAIKRSATLNDFTPVKNRENGVESTVTKSRYPIGHTRTSSDVPALNRTAGDLASAAGTYKRPSPVSSSPSRFSRLPNVTATSRPSQIRLPGQGLRQVSGQKEAESPNARSRKQAMSPDKLIKGTLLSRTEGVARRTSPPRMRTGFRPTATPREGSTHVPERSTGRQQGGITSRSQSSVALAPVSRTGSSTSTAPARSSGLPARSSASSSHLSRLSSQTATRLPTTAGARIPAASAASLPGRTTTGLPRPRGGVRSSTNTTGSTASSVVRSGSTASIASNGRIAAPLASRPRTATTTLSGYARTGIVSDKGLAAPKREVTDIRSRIERPRQQPR